ncbi:hypothetical protein CMO86_09610, partial [Candidatus Woesearchaeota archaeon]|nr:hypothetical protein [Candidatus Woesearchaeota archaeon]
SPDILPDTPSGVSGGSKLAKITDGAVSFDGSGDTLSLTGSSDVQFGTGIFTAECFVYADGYPGSGVYGIFDTGTAVNGNRFSMVLYPSGLISIDNNTNLLQSSSAMRSNAWNHVAFVREGTGSNEAKLYINGVLSNQATISTDFNNDDLLIGKTIDNYSWKGQISNVRIVKGTAVYTSNFTPPTRALTNVTNTKLLCCQSNTSAIAAAVNPGTAAITSFSGFRDSTTSSRTWDDSSSSSATSQALGPDDIYWIDLGSNITVTNVRFKVVSSASSNLSLTNFILRLSTSSSSLGTETCASGCTASAVNTVNSGSAPGEAIIELHDFSQSTRYLGITNGSGSYSGTIIYSDVQVNLPIHPIGNVTATNFNPFNTDINTVRGQESGYVTFNPLRLSANAPTLSENNLTVTAGGSAAWYNSGTTIDVSSGKWFWEVYPRTVGGSGFTVGVALEGYEWNRDTSGTGLPWLGSATGTSWSVYSTGQKYFGASGTNYMDAFTTSDVIGVALDVDANTLTYYQNGISKGVAFSDVNPEKGKSLQIGLSVHGTGSNKASINFGQNPFKFSPPAGFQPLNTANVRPETVISRPDQYVGIVTYMGAGGTKKVDGLKFSPDMVWVKALDSDFAPMLGDSVRGFSETTMLSPSSNAEEDRSTDPTDGSERGYISAKNNRGFTVVDGSGTSQVNGSGEDYVAWCWKAGGNSGNFNVDYVGYSTAGDAAMSIADQNTTGYNTDQNWGSGATGEINPGGGALESGCFNGDFSNSINSYWGDASKAITYTFNDLPFKKIRFYMVANSVSNSYVKFNGVAQTEARIRYPSLKFGWVEAIDVPSPLNKIEVFTHGSADFISLYAVEVDGKILVNSSGVTPPNLPSIPATGASVGTKQGFSIVTYTGTGSAGTIPHRLTQDPEFVIFKQRNNQDDWRVFHKDLDPDETQDYYLILQSTNGKSADQNQSFMNRVPPTGPVIHLGTDSAINGSSTTMVAYSWHSVPGLQKFGTFAGNSNADGTFVELGFRPALLWVKRTDSTGNWVILDTKRNPTNPVKKSLYADSSDNEYTPGQNWADILSNGFKIRATYGEVNVGTYVYCAWAEAPSIDLFGGGANAR